MLEVKNLSKIYKSKVKNGTDTRALDDVSLSFPERGMVFLLGKSGSGKSTLLNVCGGLDSPTEGEIIVKGKSSKSFSQSDFDSYRNTYVGFIFQEYNILEEFSVEDNIALALELQGKPKDKQVIAELLDQVDLNGFAKRKPNTLSGGQKQRIAIARALVKEPEIIMADEPTGALDSATGKQVFDTLKKLSQDKLVIVVSHDREFAEQYADRIIELKDGKILSDVTKINQKQESISENVSVLGDVLCIKGGGELDEKDLAQINQFLRASKGDVIIASGEKDVASFKKVSRITDDGEKEVFVDTDEGATERKEYQPEDSKFIRSKLPVRHAAKIGVSSLKSKPVRLFFTILLCVVSFVLFGLLSTLTFYDSEATFKQTLRDTARDYVAFEKLYEVDAVWYMGGQKQSEYTTTYHALFSPEEVQAQRERFGNGVFGGISTSMSYPVRSRSSSYWSNQIMSVAYLPEDNPLRETLIGAYPAKDDEICISSYMADVIYHCKSTDADGKEINLSSPQDIIGKSIQIEGTTYKIVGILDSGEINPKYDSLKESTGEVNYSLLRGFEMELQDGFHQMILVTENKLRRIAARSSMYNSGAEDYYQRSAATVVRIDGMTLGDELPEYPNSRYLSVSRIDPSAVTYLHGKNGALAANEVIVDDYAFADAVARFFSENDQDTALIEKCYTLSRGGYWDQNGDLIPLTDAEREALLNEIINALGAHSLTLTFQLMDHNHTMMGERCEYTIVGVVKGDNQGERFVYLSDDTAAGLWNLQKGFLESYEEINTAYKNDPNALYSRLYVPYDQSDTQTDALWSIYSNKTFAADDSKLILHGSYIDSLELVDDMVETLSKVFLYIGLALALFAILLFSNFISVSISQKKKEIGILRAVGARSLDVFKIFFSESFVIALISTALSTAGTAILCSILNKTVAPELGASIFVFGFASFGIMVAIALLTAVIATFLPVWNAAKKKPVESIRAL